MDILSCMRVFKNSGPMNPHNRILAANKKFYYALILFFIYWYYIFTCNTHIVTIAFTEQSMR